MGTSGVPADVESQHGDAYVRYFNIKYGELDSTVGPAPAPGPSPPSPSPSPSPSGCPGGSLSNCMNLCPTDPTAFQTCVKTCEARCGSEICLKTSMFTTSLHGMIDRRSGSVGWCFFFLRGDALRDGMNG